MANTSLIKRSSVANKVPTVSDLSLGELAVNTYDGKLFLKKSVGGTESIVDLTNADKLDGQDGSYYTGYTDTAISNLIDSSPAALNTLNELSAALNDDASFSTTVTNSIATKLPLAGGTLTGNLAISSGQLTLENGNEEQIHRFWSNSSDSDIYGLLSGSTFGTILEGANNGHHVIALRDNDSNDSFAIVSGGNNFQTDNTYDKLVARFYAGGNVFLGGTCTATTFSGSGASLTNIPAAQLTGVLPALDGSNLTGLTVNNAQTLDNLDSTQFLRSDADDSTSGSITFSNDDDGIFLYGGGRFYKKSGTGMMVRLHNGGTQLQVENNSGTVLGTFWHSGNDGSGSGLDADTLDGVNSTSFVRSDVADTFSGNLTGSSGTNIKLDGNMGTAGTTAFNSMSGYLEFTNDYNDSARGANKIRLQTDNNWLAGFGISANSHDIYTGGNLNFYKSNSTTSFTNLATLNSSGSLSTSTQGVVWGASNDGSGSGLDADTLDGVNSTSFLRSDADDSFSGKLSCTNRNEAPSATVGCLNLKPSASGGKTGIVLQSNVNSGSDFGYLWWYDDNNNYANNSGNIENGVLLIGIQNDATNSVAKDAVAIESSGDIFLNAGIGTGIAGANSWSSTLGNLYVGNTTTKYKVFHEGNINDVTAANVVGVANSSDTHYRVPFLSANTGTAAVYTDTSDGITYNPSSNVLTAVNFSGNGSAITNVNATTLDSIDSGSFVRSDTGDTLSGNYNTTGTWLIGGAYSNNAYNSVSSTRLLFGGGDDQDNYHIGTNLENYGGNFTKLDLRWHTGIRMGAQAGYGGIRFFNNEDLSSVLFSIGKGDGNVRVESGELYHNTSGTSDKYWREGNDGSGSGLDADKFDGLDSVTFLRQESSVTSEDWNTFIDGTEAGWRTVLNHSGSNRPSSSYTYGTVLSFGQSGQAKFQLYAPENASSGDNLWYRTGWNATYRPWVKILDSDDGYWSSGNDGAGSGLDADTLDGISSASFLRSDADDVVADYNNKISYYSNSAINTGSGSQASLECFNGTIGNDAFMSFHVGGDFALYFGLDGGINDLAVGGWSMGAVSNRVWHAGNDGSGSGLDADVLDGKNLSASGDRWGVVIHAHTDGVVEFGKYLDFHESDGSTGDFNFRIYAQSNALHTGGGTVYGFSDINHKKNITKITDPLTKIKEISGYTFNWKSNNNSGGGCIAQEVETILPELISTVSNGDLPDGTNNDGKYLNYDGVIGLLVETCKEMITKITNLETEVNNLKSA